MRRREFITLVGGAAAAWPIAALGQQPERMRRIGVFLSGTPLARPEVFAESLRNLGWMEGHNIHVDTRFPTGKDQYQLLAKQMVAEKPEVIFAQTTPRQRTGREQW
jgi:putative tryptophan/tyrosine transport system substrate-binding protein